MPYNMDDFLHMTTSISIHHKSAIFYQLPIRYGPSVFSK